MGEEEVKTDMIVTAVESGDIEETETTQKAEMLVETTAEKSQEENTMLVSSSYEEPIVVTGEELTTTKPIEPSASVDATDQNLLDGDDKEEEGKEEIITETARDEEKLGPESALAGESPVENESKNEVPDNTAIDVIEPVVANNDPIANEEETGHSSTEITKNDSGDKAPVAGLFSNFRSRLSSPFNHSNHSNTAPAEAEDAEEHTSAPKETMMDDVPPKKEELEMVDPE